LKNTINSAVTERDHSSATVTGPILAAPQADDGKAVVHSVAAEDQCRDQDDPALYSGSRHSAPADAALLRRWLGGILRRHRLRHP